MNLNNFYKNKDGFLSYFSSLYWFVNSLKNKKHLALHIIRLNIIRKLWDLARIFNQANQRISYIVWIFNNKLFLWIICPK